MTPTSASVSRGRTATFTVTVAPTNGFNGPVTLSIAGQNLADPVTITPNPVNGGGTVTVTIKTLSSEPAKARVVIFTGTSGALAHSVAAQMIVS